MMTKGFRILGSCLTERRLVDWPLAFEAYCGCDGRARVDTEAYLSAFTYGDDFAGYLSTTGSTRGFDGVCWGPWLWFDIDRDPAVGGIDAALVDACRLAGALSDHYGVPQKVQLWFYSGSKGFHCGIPTALWCPEPSVDFHRIARRLAETMADTAGVAIDTAVYDKVRAFRAPNSRHPKTGRHKRHLSVDELAQSASAILEAADSPVAFNPPAPPAQKVGLLEAKWDQCRQQVRGQAQSTAHGRAAMDQGLARLNRATLEFIRDGAAVGERARRVYQAAANIAEFGCPSALAHALLTEAALDAGLPPAEIRRQIDCGLETPARAKGGAA